MTDTAFVSSVGIGSSTPNPGRRCPGELRFGILQCQHRAGPPQQRGTRRGGTGSHQQCPSSSSTSKPPQKSMDLTSSRESPGAPEILQHHQTMGEIHGFYQFPFSSAILRKHSPKFHLSEAHSMEFSPIWLHDHKTQHDNLIISIASIKFCSFQKFKSSIVTHQAWKNLNWIVPSY